MSIAALKPTRAAALDRLSRFVPAAGRRYARTRDFDFGPRYRGNVSVLSPYLSHRLLLEEEAIRSALERHTYGSAEKFIEEIFWRAYFKGSLEYRPTVWRSYRTSVSQLLKRLETSDALRRRYEQAVAGNTGIDCFDAWARELEQIGYLHNHARMWFASIWIFTLQLPWALGADFFYRHLLDGDAASNTLGWRWVAGLHTRGKTYRARAANICRYTDGRFNPKGQLATLAPALNELTEHAEEPLRAGDPVPRKGRWGLLITEEDTCPSTLIGENKPVAVLGLASPGSRSPLPIGRAAQRFAVGAVASAVADATRTYRVHAESKERDDWSAVLTEWSRQNKLDGIVTAYPSVGPVSELVLNAESALASDGVRLYRARRRYDDLAWPHTNQGFYKLKRRIPDILRHLEIADGDIEFAETA